MGLGGIGLPQLLIILAIVVMIFGTKKIRNLGWDLGSAFKGVRAGFKEAVETVDEIAPELEDMRGDAEHIERKTRKLRT